VRAGKFSLKAARGRGVFAGPTLLSMSLYPTLSAVEVTRGRVVSAQPSATPAVACGE
jgi:hypothetical protein